MPNTRSSIDVAAASGLLCRRAPGRAARLSAGLAATLLSCTALTATAQTTTPPPAPPASADTANPPPQDAATSDIVVTGSLDALPTTDVGSVFGFAKTLVETPRSASTISNEQIERFGITDIYDLVAQAPGTFTNSFFGVGGALDIRGTPGEVYFRGVRRLDNPGNYPTPIGASDRIDIVRGPASPIFGPSKTGGYMNFVPKSARVKGGALLDAPSGEVTATGGSYRKADLKAEVRGPFSIGSQKFGYSVFAEVEDSGSYYRNMSTRQHILQGAFDTDFSSNLRLEFGGMYQNFKGQQNGGWNRLTQDLVDNGTYITGSAQPIDTDGDGQISQGEVLAASGGNTLSVFGTFGCQGAAGSPFAASFTDACFTSTYPYLALQNAGTTRLSRKNTLTGKNDRLENKSSTYYADLIFTGDGGFSIKNQLFFDSYENINENAYGFSQFHDSYVVEDKIVAAYEANTKAGKFSFQVSPSIRYTDFKHGDDFNFEYFNRVDLTVGYTPLSDRLLSTECDCGYTNYVTGHYTDYAMAGLADLAFNFGLGVTLGARYDYIDVKSRYHYDKMEAPTAPESADGGKGAWSWSASANYKLPLGLIPYVTVARQSTVVAGQGAEIYPELVGPGSFIAASKLYEGGVKGQFLNDALYAAVSVYKQKRTDFNNQSITVNQAVETKGLEAEARWAVDRHLLVTGAYTRTKVYNLTALETGTLFGFFGIEDLVNVANPALFLGGQPIGLIPIPDRSASRRAGIPTNLYSLTATYAFDNGLALSASGVAVDSVFSSQSQVVKLPAYAKLDTAVSYEAGPWLARVVVKNVFDKKYFRANFTELFGATIVLPELPRTFQASLTYKF